MRKARALLLLVALATFTAPALANGGIVRISHRPVGPWFVTVYSAPNPLRTGQLDISALVQDSTDEIIDIPVMVDAEPVGFAAESVEQPATRRQATNKLFKAAKFPVETPGRWSFRIRIGAAADPGFEGAGGELSFEADVAKTTILDRPYLLTVMVLLPLAVLAWVLLGRGEEER
jgi:hypothetical protein